MRKGPKETESQRLSILTSSESYSVPIYIRVILWPPQNNKERDNITYKMGCVAAFKDDDGNLTIGKFIIEHEIGTQRFEDITFKHIRDMTEPEKEEFEKIKKYFQ